MSYLIYICIHMRPLVSVGVITIPNQSAEKEIQKSLSSQRTCIDALLIQSTKDTPSDGASCTVVSMLTVGSNEVAVIGTGIVSCKMQLNRYCFPCLVLMASLGSF